MRIANSIVNRLGPTFVQSRMDATGPIAPPWCVLSWCVREAFGLRDLWDSLEALDGKVSATAQLEAMLDIRGTSSRAITWFLTRLGRAPKISTDIPAFRKEIEKLRANIDGSVTPTMKTMIQGRYDRAREAGLPDKGRA